MYLLLLLPPRGSSRASSSLNCHKSSPSLISCVATTVTSILAAPLTCTIHHSVNIAATKASFAHAHTSCHTPPVRHITDTHETTPRIFLFLKHTRAHPYTHKHTLTHTRALHFRTSGSRVWSMSDTRTLARAGSRVVGMCAAYDRGMHACE